MCVMRFMYQFKVSFIKTFNGMLAIKVTDTNFYFSLYIKNIVSHSFSYTNKSRSSNTEEISVAPGKGVLPDNHPQCVAPARSRALLQADVVLLLGARLNWILHFGRPPRYAHDVKFIQVNLFHYTSLKFL